MLSWVLEDAKGVVIAEYNTRHNARRMKSFYQENVFADWLADVNFPIKIIREQWELKVREVVR